MFRSTLVGLFEFGFQLYVEQIVPVVFSDLQFFRPSPFHKPGVSIQMHHHLRTPTNLACVSFIHAELFV